MLGVDCKYLIILIMTSFIPYPIGISQISSFKMTQHHMPMENESSRVL